MQFFLKSLIWFTLFFILILSSTHTVQAKSKTDLLEDFLEKQIFHINELSIKYNINKDTTIQNSLNTLKDYKNIVQKLEYSSLENEKIELILQRIIEGVKKINTNIKPIFRDKQQNEESIKNIQLYKNLAHKIEIKIDRLKKHFFGNKNTRVKSQIARIQDIKYKLITFQKININDEKVGKTIFMRLMQNVKIEILKLKKII